MFCEQNCYMWNVFVYCGTMDPMSGLNHAKKHRILMDKLLNYKGHVLYKEPIQVFSLAKKLLKNKTIISGTLLSNKKYLLKQVLKAKLKQGETVAYTKDHSVVIKER